MSTPAGSSVRPAPPRAERGAGRATLAPTDRRELTPRVRTASASALSPVQLPRARALTDLLLGTGPSAGAHRPERGLDPGTAFDVGGTLDGLLAAASRGAPPGAPRCLRIATYQLSSALGPRSSAVDDTPFRWSARTARRTLGLAGLRAVLERRAPTPGEGVEAVLSHPDRGPGGWTPSPGSCWEWLRSLPPPGRAAVAAEAATWATELWTALDWARLGPELRVGDPDRWWGWRGPVRVALRGRADVRVGAGLEGAHLLVLPGHPTPDVRAALLLSALVDVLARGCTDAPARVVGWWPECGKAWSVPVDAGGLLVVVGAVGRAVEHALGRRVPRPDPPAGMALRGAAAGMALRGAAAGMARRGAAAGMATEEPLLGHVRARP